MKEHKYVFNLLRCHPKENNETDLCIWCGLPNKKNNAHIFSRSLLKTNHLANILTNSVCVKCNSFWGNKIEDWFLKYTPIATWKNQIFGKSELLNNLKYVPNFVWLETIKEWVVVNHANVKDAFPTQLILTLDASLLLFHFDKSMVVAKEDADDIYHQITSSINSGTYTSYMTNNLPDGFNPRLLCFNGKIILMSRNEEESNRLQNKILSKEVNTLDNSTFKRKTIGKIDNLVINYFWSIKKYAKWSGKIGFEFLCLLENSSLGFNDCFKSFKEQIFENSSKDDKLKISSYEGKGLNVKRLTAPGWLTYVKAENAITGYPVFQTATKNCHKVFIYEIKGYLLFCLSLFNIEPCQIVIAKDIKLDSIYYIEYDYLKDELKFFTARKSDMLHKVSSDFVETIKYFQENPEMMTVMFSSPYEMSTAFD